MPFARSLSQPRQSLAAFYQELLLPGSTPEEGHIATAMLTLIEQLQLQFVTTPLWGLTSHFHLLLQDQPYYDASDQWGVLVIGNQTGYQIEFCRPKATPQETTILLRTHASTITETLASIAVAMTESGGWQSTKEIEDQRASAHLSDTAWQLILPPFG
jgi:hypothetical protein